MMDLTPAVSFALGVGNATPFASRRQTTRYCGKFQQVALDKPCRVGLPR
jgi:hypothetical protein